MEYDVADGPYLRTRSLKLYENEIGSTNHLGPDSNDVSIIFIRFFLSTVQIHQHGTAGVNVNLLQVKFIHSMYYSLISLLRFRVRFRTSRSVCE
jgi:hypothetical protein